MGKKNRIPTQSRSTGQAALPPALHKLFATAQQAAPLLNIPPPEWNEQEVRDLWTDAPPEVLQHLGAFIEQFASFGTQLKNGLQGLDEQKMAIEAERQSLAQERQELSTQKSALSEEQLKQSELSSAFHDQQALLDAKQSELLRKEQALLVQEAALRGGLVSEREEALKVLREQIDLLEGRRDRLAVEMQAQSEQILNQARADAAALIEVARARTLTLQADEIEQAKRSAELDKREERLKINEELLRVGRSAAVEAVQEELEQVQRAAKEEKLAFSKGWTGSLKSLIDCRRNSMSWKTCAPALVAIPARSSTSWRNCAVNAERKIVRCKMLTCAWPAMTLPN